MISADDDVDCFCAAEWEWEFFTIISTITGFPDFIAFSRSNVEKRGELDEKEDCSYEEMRGDLWESLWESRECLLKVYAPPMLHTNKNTVIETIYCNGDIFALDE